MEHLGGKQMGQSRDLDRSGMGMNTDTLQGDVDGSGQQPGEMGF